MAGSSPEEAVDAFVALVRRPLACVARGTAIASGTSRDRINTITLFPEGQDGGDPARIRTHDGDGELLFQYAHQYRVVQLPERAAEERYVVRPASYRYDILDRDGEEVVVFHWEPEGRGAVRLPHLHLSAAKPIVLPQRFGSRVASTKTHLSRLHLPTGHIGIADVVELLIRDFAAVPFVDGWETILERSRFAPNAE